MAVASESKAKPAPFPPAPQSATVFEKAVGLFEEDVDAAVRWLTSPMKALRGRSRFTARTQKLAAARLRT
jgi:hypothetical protein